MAEPHPWAPAARFVLSGAEFDIVWEHLGLGATPAALRLSSPGRTRAERLRIAAAGLDGLRGRGLAGPTGADPVLVRLLGLLAGPDRELEVRARFGAPLRAVAAERAGEGVLAVHTGDTVTVSAAGAPSHAAVSALPPTPAGPGPSIGVPTAVLAALLDGSTAGGSRPPPAAARPDPAGLLAVAAARSEDTTVERLTALLRGPAHRAQICAVRHDRWGSPSRLPGHVAVVDTPRGRYRLTRETGPHGGPEWATLAPADRRSLQPLLEELFGARSGAR